MKKGIMTFDRVMKDRKRRERVLNRRKNAPKQQFKWVQPPELSKVKKAGLFSRFWAFIKRVMGKNK